MSKSRYTRKQKTKETKFDMICRLAREEDADGLRALETAEGHIWYTKNDEDYSPMHLLASEGHVSAVWFIINNFHKYADDAVSGFAEAGLVGEVDKLLEGKSLHDFANYEAYNEYRDSRPSVFRGVKNAVYGYAVAGLHEQVERILKDNPELMGNAFKGYIKGRCWQKVFELQKRGITLEPETISKIFKGNDHDFLTLLCHITSETLRSKLINDRYPNHSGCNTEKILALTKKSAQTNRLMVEYGIDCEQARALYKLQQAGQLQGVRTWLLEGMQVAKPLPSRKLSDDESEEEDDDVNNLPLLLKEMYFHISTFVLGLPLDDTKKIIKSVHDNLFANVIKEKASKFAYGVFGTAKYFGEHAKAVEQYESRIAQYK